MIFRRLYSLLRVLVVVVWAAAVVSCSYPVPAPKQPSLGKPNAMLSLAREVVDMPEQVIPSDVIFEGVVTANDRSDNFYQSIVIEDETAAVEIKVGLYDLHNRFPLGARVRVDASGLAVMLYDGVVQMGRTRYDYNDHTVEPLGTPIELDARVEVVAKESPAEPTIVVVGELQPDMCGGLVRVVGVEYVGEEPCWATSDYGVVAEREFRTSQGDTIVVATSRYADFADQFIPTEEVNICGILYCNKQADNRFEYKLKMRSVEDVEKF